MSAHSRLPDEYSKPAKNTSHRTDFKGSLRRQQSSNAAKEKLPSSKPQGCSRLLDNTEESCPFAQPYIDRHNEPRRQLDDEHVIKLTSSGSFQRHQVSSKVNTEVDIVRHMKNLPSYLHPVEKPKNVQDRALNFGVLDWKRLEKWRDNERLPKNGESRASSRVDSLSIASETYVPSRLSRQKKYGSVDLDVNYSPEETLFNHAQHYQEKVKYVKDSKYSALGTVAGKQSELSQKLKFSSSSLDVINDKGKRIDGNQKMTLQKGLSQSSIKSSFRLPSVPISDQQGEKSIHNDSRELYPKHSADEPQDIVLLIPKLSRRSSSKNHHIVESKRSHDGKSVEKNQKSHSCRYSPQGLQSGEYTDEIPHSFPLPDNGLTAQGIRSEACTSDRKNDMRRSSDMKNSNVDYSVPVETSEGTNFGTIEKPAVKSRPQSPSRRFSFNLGKLGRSFSFRESSTVSNENSKYVDAKSGPIDSQSLSGIVDIEHNREKAHTSSIGWSSSFRKILNPVLKPKAHSGQAAQSNLVVPEPTNASKLLHDEKHHTSSYQALVQLTFKNRLPFFKFVAGNSSDILAAAVKDLPTKTDGKFSYSFYSVTEIKKKSTKWMSHGSKDKNCSFGQTALCQMKISATRSSDMITECVLYGVRAGEADKGDPEVLLNKELAAIILKDSYALAYGSEPKQGKEPIPLSPFDTTKPRETENCNSITVILPGAIHGLPNEGAPSSLVSRWKSGGLCDCGGWDMGCKLRILIDQKERTDSLTSTNTFSLIDQVDNSNQDAEGRMKPIFCVAPFKDGYYSVHFNASISHIEAFATCVAVLTSQRLSDILDVNLLLERNPSTGCMPAKDKDNKPKVFHSQVPAKYLSSPPLSPAGRI